MFIYLNGQLVKKEDAMISPFDHGFLYGVGLFETFRIYDGHPFLLDDHLERLNHGLAVLNIKHRFIREETAEILRLLLEKNDLSNAYIRLNISAGLGEIGLQTAAFSEPNIIVFSKQLPPAGGLSDKKAVLLERKRNTPEGDERLKSHHFLNNLFAKREIGDSPELEGIFLTEDGFLAEGIVSNLFWKKGRTVYTPALSTGILNGITRQFIIELSRKNGYNIQEGHFALEAALEADEMFVTNSIQEVVGISNFEGQNYPGSEGELVQQLHRNYRQYCKSLWSRHLIGRD